jgi:hypothetical protein
MKKILLVEDRQERQSQFLPNHEQDMKELESMSDLKMIRGEAFTNFIEELATESDLTKLLNYDLLIFHRSAIAKKGLVSKINEYVQKNKKSLIYFSGGITQNVYSESNYPFLLINSKDFYSNRLITFLQKYSAGNTKLLWLLYGDNWQLTYLLKYRELLNGTVYPGNPIENREELESIIGKPTISDLNMKIDEIFKLL